MKKNSKLEKEAVAKLLNNEYIVISYDEVKKDWYPSKYNYFFPGKNKNNASYFLKSILSILKNKHRLEIGKLNTEHLVGKVLSLKLLLKYIK